MCDLNQPLWFRAPSALILTGLFGLAGSNGMALAVDGDPSGSAGPAQATHSWSAELVAVQRDGAYIDFRVPVPEDDLARIEAVEPGRWVTATAPRRTTDWASSVITIRSYTDVS